MKTVFAILVLVLVSSTAFAAPIGSPDAKPLLGCTLQQDCDHVAGPLSVKAFKGESDILYSLSSADKVEKWFDPFTNEALPQTRR